ncbi:MAG: Adenosine specific kinase [Candidatus Methanofastidiosum methylothiophilum]|uniref:Adenosine specific kinase n=1 Tax=Candidatus Methanofastidiosum methylothiophilum TaxID=1705564 RepID=A0A150J990_9EURY|nr:MAG: Adenosine specific kinase [Candidatus Methanofastidiosum methylthiophilus]
MEMNIIDIKKDEGVEFIVGQGNFSIFTVDDLAKTLLTCVAGIKIGVAMNEAKPKLTRVAGNDEHLKDLAANAALKIGAGHVFVIMMRGAFPINVLNTVKAHPSVCTVYGASENPFQVIVAKTNLGCSVIGVVDGTSAEKIEDKFMKRERRDLLEKIGYKVE